MSTCVCVVCLESEICSKQTKLENDCKYLQFHRAAEVEKVEVGAVGVISKTKAKYLYIHYS